MCDSLMTLLQSPINTTYPVEMIFNGIVAFILSVAVLTIIFLVWRDLDQRSRLRLAREHCDEWGHHAIMLYVTLNQLRDDANVTDDLRRLLDEKTESLTLLVLQNCAIGIKSGSLSEWMQLEEACRVALDGWKELGIAFRDAVYGAA